jgi:hypothetical protein
LLCATDSIALNQSSSATSSDPPRVSRDHRLDIQQGLSEVRVGLSYGHRGVGDSLGGGHVGVGPRLVGGLRLGCDGGGEGAERVGVFVLVAGKEGQCGFHAR